MTACSVSERMSKDSIATKTTWILALLQVRTAR
jgi:hypothetical protein